MAGPEEAATELRRVLPRILAHRVVVVIPADIDAGQREILDKTLAVERRIEREEEDRLLRQLRDLAGPGGRAVLGARPTLAALWADLVQTLVVAPAVEVGVVLAPSCACPRPCPKPYRAPRANDNRQQSTGERAEIMANEQSKRQSERQGERQQSTAIERAEGGERGLATRQYQDPFSLFDSLFERMQRDFFGASLLNALVLARGEGNGSRFVRVPRMRMRDTGEALELAAELPGIDARNVSVQVEDDSLTISGEQREEEERDETRTERWLSFYRQIALPDGVDTEQAQASDRDGVLIIRFPKTKGRSSAREIPVTTQQSGQQQQTKERAA